MDIYERIEENRTKIASIYDLAAICYDYLRMQIDNQALFLAEYLYAENKAAESSAAPLNENYMENSYIYRIHGESMIKKAAVELEFRDKIRTTDIRHNFICIRKLEKAEHDTGLSRPRLVTLHIDQ